MTDYSGTVSLKPDTGMTGDHATAILSYVRSGTNNVTADTVFWTNPFKTRVILRGGLLLLNAVDSGATPATVIVGTAADDDGVLASKAAGFSSATANNVLFYTLDGALINTILEPGATITLKIGTIGTTLAGAKIHLHLNVQAAA
jgi:hypothetical protein